MIYTRIEWIWTDEGLKETFVESCEYEGEFMMCGGGDDDDDEGGSSDNDTDYFTPSGQGGEEGRSPRPTTLASTSTPEPQTAGFGYTPETGFTYNTTKERSDAAADAMHYATIHGTLKDTEFENDPFLMNTTKGLRTNDPDYLGDDNSSSGSATTTTGTDDTSGDDTTVVTDEDEEEPESTIGDEAALRRVRRRLRDRMGRRSTRGRGGAETVGTGYTLGG